MRLSDSRRSAYERIAMLADVVAGSESQYLLAIDGGIEVKVEGLQRLGGVERSSTKAKVQLLLGTALHFVLQEAREELDVGPLALNCLAVTGV
jgi:hypothetical protein